MKDPRDRWSRFILRCTSGLFLLLFAIAAGKVIHLQVFQHEFLAREAERQHQRTLKLTPARGTIYDRNLAEMAITVEMESCAARPSKIPDPERAAAQIAPILGVSPSAILSRLKSNGSFVWLQRMIPPETAQRIKNLAIAGIEFQKEPRRFYPNSETAAHVIGFTGLDPVGLEGVERKYDATIQGNPTYLVTGVDAFKREVDLGGGGVRAGEKGNGVVLTIDRTIQHLTERELARGVAAARARHGIAIVMEPATGRILAMANYPTFNPNSFQQAPPQNLRNRAISDTYEPGSTLKTLLVAAALEEKLVRPGDRFSCENGVYTIGNRTIHDTHSHGVLTVTEILKYSSNIGAAKIGSRLGAERLGRYLRNFGLGERCGIDLPGEATGILRDQGQWYGIDLATISFGQGVTVTPLQLLTAVSAIANGGSLMKPYVVERIIDNEGNVVKEFAPTVRRRVISRESAETVASMMVSVTTPGGTGTAAAVDGYRVAGKTGTSQKVDPVTRTYSPNRRIASFVGFVPSSAPRLSILVVMDEPQTSPYGGVVAAPVFREIAEQSLRYLHVPPEIPSQKKPLLASKTDAPAPQQVTEPLENAAAEGGEIRGDVRRMPEFRGMTMRQVLRVMERQGVNVRIVGSGRVVEQNPLPGVEIGPQMQVWVRLAPPT